MELSSEKGQQILIPKGFAHGLIVLSDTAEILYKCDDYYFPPFEGGIIFNDPDLSLGCFLSRSEIIISD